MRARRSAIRECLGGFDKSNVKQGGEMEWSGVETPLWHGPVSTPSSRRYGDCWMFSLIIGNCEPVSVPAHRYTYSYFNDTCQRSRLLQNLMSSTATAKEMCSRAYVWSCTHARTHTHTQILTAEWSQQIGSLSRKRPEGKEFWQGICLAVSAWQNKSLRTLSGTPKKWEREREKRDKLVILSEEGCLGACIRCYRYRLMVSPPPLRSDPGEMMHWAGRLGHVSLL